MESPTERWHAFVEGLVQGVGFRYYVRDTAARLGATGWVRNRTDGRVEIVAEAEPSVLSNLEAQVRRGPPASRVEAIAATRGPATGEFSGFRLQPTL
ncbi:MAG TPA: acylphosphatase [Anaerolineales bacterium]|nr:acylphosphatase [Anaerolineales bacterium]